MRFKLRRHMFVTALAAISLLPFTGCSSSQQSGGDDGVEATDQGGDEGGGDKAASADSSQGEDGSGSDQVATNNAADSGEGNTAGKAGGNEVAANGAMPTNATADTGSSDGDLKEMITEMGTNGAAPAAENAAAAPKAAPEAAAPPAPQTVAQAPAAPGLPETGSKMAYVSEAGDTLGKVAAKIYGDQKRWRDISSLSGMTDPNHIFPGDVVFYSLDEKTAQFAATYEAVKRNKEVVQHGDTLASIAKRVYGTSKAWKQIWRQNDKIDNPDKLETGMTVFYVEKGGIKTTQNQKTKQISSLAGKKVAKHHKTKSINSFAKQHLSTVHLVAVAP